MNKTMITGFPRIGENRELKNALENYWSNKTNFKELENVARELRKKHWLDQNNKGIAIISSNDFSYYDTMLDTTVMLNAIPERFRNIEDNTERYFAMARGNDSAVAMEMTKWFNTNYHYIVPELDENVNFQLSPEKSSTNTKKQKISVLKQKSILSGQLLLLDYQKLKTGKTLLFILTERFRFTKNC